MSAGVTHSTGLDRQLRDHSKADGRAVVELIATAVGLAGGAVAMFWSLEVGYWLTLLLALPSAAFLLRLFLIQHDCGHGSFFRSGRANRLGGKAISLVTLVPYEYWRRNHAIHHKTAGDLDNRSLGDIDTLTVAEYLTLPRAKRWAYRLYRNPLLFFLVGPSYQTLVKHRWPTDIPRSWRREWASIHWTNGALASTLLVGGLTVGIVPFLKVFLPLSIVATTFAFWVFYVGHQFEETCWRRHEQWSFQEVGLAGSSYIALPKPLHWLTANICFHHVHHLNVRIPSYRLAECYAAIPALQQAKTMTFWKSLRCFGLALWDEQQGRLIRFKDLGDRPIGLPSTDEAGARKRDHG